MRLPKFEYLEPKTLEEPTSALASNNKGSVRYRLFSNDSREIPHPLGPARS